MKEAQQTPARALRNFGLVAAATCAAASIWAASPPEEAYLLDAGMWRDEVKPSIHWPTDGWVRLQQIDGAIDVRAVKPSDAAEVRPDALFFRQPALALKEGVRPTYRHSVALKDPKLGQDYELTLGKVRFNLRVESGVKGMEYTVGYGGKSYRYILGPFDATHTAVRVVADLDGDSQPDFLVDVEDATFLLLSTQARPGQNMPTAELWAKAEEGS